MYRHGAGRRRANGERAPAICPYSRLSELFPGGLPATFKTKPKSSTRRRQRAVALVVEQSRRSCGRTACGAQQRSSDDHRRVASTGRAAPRGGTIGRWDFSNHLCGTTEMLRSGSGQGMRGTSGSLRRGRRRHPACIWRGEEARIPVFTGVRATLLFGQGSGSRSACPDYRSVASISVRLTSDRRRR